MHTDIFIFSLHLKYIYIFKIAEMEEMKNFMVIFNLSDGLNPDSC